MLVLTCHAHVAAIFAGVGATVRSLGVEPPPRATRRPDALPASRPTARRAVAVVSEPPVVPVPPRSGDDLHAAWPAEDFFFGQSSAPEAATTANDAGNGNADEPDDDRKIRQPARRTAARSRRRR
jgi:hypothetical protein